MKNNDKSKQLDSFTKAFSYYLYKSCKTQSDICKDLNLTSSTVSEWFTGKRLPRADRVQSLADYLNAPVKQFYDFSQPTKEDTEIEIISKKLKENELYRSLVITALKLSEDNIKLMVELATKLVRP